MLTSTASFINATAGGNGDNPTELTGPDILDVVRALRGNNAYSFLSGIQGENRFGTAPKMNGRDKPWVIDFKIAA